MGKDQGRESARRLIMMGVHVIGTAVQDEGDSFAPRSSAKTFVFEPISTYRECLDITLSCVESSIEVIGSGLSGLQKRQVYGGGRLCYSARRSNTRGRGA